MRGPAVRPIVIAAGGTGGHFFPAEALASELVARGHRVALMTDGRAASKLPESFQGREVFVLPGAGIAGRGLRRGLSAVARLAAGTVQARLILNRLDAAAIVGFGGYPTVPPVLATVAMRNAPPVILHEQNAVLGRANRLLASRATALALSFEQTSRLPLPLPKTVTGNPVRPGFFFSPPLEGGVGGGVATGTDRAAGTPPPGPLPQGEGEVVVHLLVLGGSLGARVFADAVPAALAALPLHQRAALRVVQQCRAEDIARVGQAYAASGIAAELSPFFTDIPTRLADASLVIARAGASTVAELAVAGRAAILVPLPGAIDDHQAANARALSAVGGAWVLPQTEIGNLRDRLASLLAVPQALAEAGAAARSFARPDAAARLADLVLSHVRVAA